MCVGGSTVGEDMRAGRGVDGYKRRVCGIFFFCFF